jgi:hypothetical protein
MDPRVKTPPAGLERQFALSVRLCNAIARVHDQIVQAEVGSPAPRAMPEQPAPWAEGNSPTAVLRRLHAQLLGLLDLVQGADAEPTPAMIGAAEACLARVK